MPARVGLAIAYCACAVLSLRLTRVDDGVAMVWPASALQFAALCSTPRRCWPTFSDGTVSRCAIELNFFKEADHREPNNRYDVFKDIARLERCKVVAGVAFMLVGTNLRHGAVKATRQGGPDTRSTDLGL